MMINGKFTYLECLECGHGDLLGEVWRAQGNLSRRIVGRYEVVFGNVAVSRDVESHFTPNALFRISIVSLGGG